MGPSAKQLIILLCLCGTGEEQQAQTAAKLQARTQVAVAMTVGERKITVAELCTAISQLPAPQRNGYTSNPSLAKDWYGPLVALADEARREHLQVPENPKLSELDRDNALVGELMQAIAGGAQPSDAQIDNYYSEHKREFEQVKARHILISDATALASRSTRSAADAKAIAEEIAAQLNGDADFAELATKDSDDPNTASKGGELGYLSHHQLEPALDLMLWSLSPGEISASFEGRFGYEIVKVEERRVQPLAAVRESIIGKLKAATLERREKEIVAAAHIGMEPAYADSPLPCEAGVQAFTLKDLPVIP